MQDIYSYIRGIHHVCMVLCYSHSVITVYGICNAVSHDKHFVLSH